MRHLLFPVETHTGGHLPTPRAIAVFFTSSDATHFAMHPDDGFDLGNLYLGEPRYDRRKSGYRPAPTPSGYEEWLASLEPKHLGDGKYQVAA